MSNLNEVDPLMRAVEQANQQQQAEQMLRGALQMALQQPHTVETHRIHMSAIQRTDKGVTLAFGTPSGERIEFEMTPQTAGQIAAELLMQESEAEAA